MKAKFVRGEDPIRTMEIGIDPKMVKRLKRMARKWPVTFDAIEEEGVYYLGVLYDDLRMDYMIPDWTNKHLGDYLEDVNILPEIEPDDGEQWFEIKSVNGSTLKRAVELFNKKNEGFDFERGEEPLTAMGLGESALFRRMLSRINEEDIISAITEVSYDYPYLIISTLSLNLYDDIETNLKDAGAFKYFDYVDTTVHSNGDEDYKYILQPEYKNNFKNIEFHERY